MNLKRVICIVLSAMLLMTMGGASVFAKSVTPAEAASDELNVVAEENMDFAAAEETATESAEATTTTEPTTAAQTGTISIEEAELENVKDYNYTGSAIVQNELVVTLDDAVLIEGTDYEVSYENNIEPSDEGAKVIVTGIGQYTGTATDSFSIFQDEETLDPVKNLKAYAGCNEIKLTWNKVEGADTYYIMRSDKTWGKDNWPRDLRTIKPYKKNWAKVSEKPYWENNVKGTVVMYKKYNYKVYAVKYKRDENGDAIIPASNSYAKNKNQYLMRSSAKKISKKCVGKLRIKVTSKQTVTLTSTNGKKKYTVHAGDRITTEGYGGGKYYFKKKGAWFRILNARVRSASADYMKKTDYTKAEAEYFVNSSNQSYIKPSKTNKKYLIWASLYTQQVHIFKKSGGKWKQVKAWDCSSGSANAPSPTGNHHIEKKIYGRHHIAHWNCFSTLNALHGIKPVRYAGYNWVNYLGQIKSNGCIRNANANAKWIWDHCSVGTKVLVF